MVTKLCLSEMNWAPFFLLLLHFLADKDVWDMIHIYSTVKSVCLFVCCCVRGRIWLVDLQLPVVIPQDPRRFIPPSSLLLSLLSNHASPLHLMIEDPALNPICLLSRTDSPTFSLYHSFFLLSLDINDNKNCEICFRVPNKRDRLDDIETAVKYFASNVEGTGDDMYGSFVITTSDGSRFYALWRGSPFLLFVAISIFPLLTFTRKLFMLLANEPSATITPLLRTLSEFPILGSASLHYEVRLSSGVLPLHFNELGLVDDDDINMIALQAFTPQMLVDTWKALILENKILVICSNGAIVPYCCEFLRRIILPLILITTYVPFLPEELLSTIEAPFPYLVGAQSESVYANRIDLSDTFVVDIDAQCIPLPKELRE